MFKTWIAVLIVLALISAANVLALSQGNGDGFTTLWMFGLFTVVLVAFLRREPS